MSRLCCPKCGTDDQIDVEAKVWVRVINDPNLGLRSDLDVLSANPDPLMDERCRVSCDACGKRGLLKRFLAEGQALGAKPLSEEEKFIQACHAMNHWADFISGRIDLAEFDRVLPRRKKKGRP